MRPQRGRSRPPIPIFLAFLLIACACATPAERQHPRPRRIAFLRAVATGDAGTQEALVGELQAGGLVEKQNLTILGADPLEAYPSPADAQRAVRTWMKDGLDLLVAFSSAGAFAARSVSSDLKIVFISIDPQAAGLVSNLRRPDRNATGVRFVPPADRTLALAKRMFPDARRAGLAVPRGDDAAGAHLKVLGGAAAAANLELVTRDYSSEQDLGSAVEALAAAGASFIVLSTSPSATRSLPALESAAAQYRLPVVANIEQARFAVMSLFPESRQLGRQLGLQALRVLEGVAVRSVPVQDPQRFTLVVNRTAAQNLGVVVPESMLREANLVR
ncbi:MAG TPA: ABC transporter substrate binding protein [Actinomycetota bacterium]|nr:ABC transporter substrate binding protein [Actinomycetota bacterium]